VLLTLTPGTRGAERPVVLAHVRPGPLGATAGDVLTKPVGKGGPDLRTAGSSAVLLAVLPGLMVHVQVQEQSGRTAGAGAAA
jgi:uncharacterized membrane-anchored protein